MKKSTKVVIAATALYALARAGIMVAEYYEEKRRNVRLKEHLAKREIERSKRMAEIKAEDERLEEEARKRYEYLRSLDWLTDNDNGEPGFRLGSNRFMVRYALGHPWFFTSDQYTWLEDQAHRFRTVSFDMESDAVWSCAWQHEEEVSPELLGKLTGRIIPKDSEYVESLSGKVKNELVGDQEISVVIFIFHSESLANVKFGGDVWGDYEPGTVSAAYYHHKEHGTLLYVSTGNPFTEQLAQEDEDNG